MNEGREKGKKVGKKGERHEGWEKGMEEGRKVWRKGGRHEGREKGGMKEGKKGYR